MGGRFAIGRPLHGLLSRQVEIFDRLFRVATATVVMCEVAVVFL